MAIVDSGATSRAVFGSGGTCQSDELKLEGDQALGVGIAKRALEEPIRQIVGNAALEGTVIVQEVRKKKTSYGPGGMGGGDLY